MRTLRHGHAGALEIDAFQEAVHLASRDTLAAFCGGYADNGVENAMNVCAFNGGNEEHWRVAQMLKVLRSCSSKIARSAGGLPSVRFEVTKSHLLTTIMTERPLSCA